MTQCAKCGAELIGTKKFCTACGTPAGDPRSPAASTGMSPAKEAAAPPSAPGMAGPSIQYAPAPASQVNPFAQTSGPRQSPPASSYGPPPSVPPELASTAPGVGDPSKGPQVSPLATSNVDSNRGALLDAIVASARPIPGTQLMPSIANPSAVSGAGPGGAPSAAGQASTPGQKRPERTQVLGVFPGIPSRPGAPAPSSIAAPSARDSSNPDMSAHGPAPVAAAPPPPPPPPPAEVPPFSPPQPASQHVGPGVPLPSSQQGWNAAPYPSAPPGYAQPMPHAPAPPPPAAPPPGYGYGFNYAPGSRVTVTWSNGQRYPGTVTQVAGNQCCVAFPDGQHHWVEMQYVAPG